MTSKVLKVRDLTRSRASTGNKFWEMLWHFLRNVTSAVFLASGVGLRLVFHQLLVKNDSPTDVLTLGPHIEDRHF